MLSSSGNVKISQNSVYDAACSAHSPAESMIVGGTTNVQISGNNITSSYSCGSGIVLQSATGSLVYHNNLVNNSVQASDDNPGKNQWDNGYPSGGNFYSNYTGVDYCSGPQQNICPSPDGVGDSPYAFDSAQDHYPLMKPFVDPPAVIYSVRFLTSLSANLGTIARTVLVTATNSTSGGVIFAAQRTVTYQ